MECFRVRYDSRVVIYERKLFTRLATAYLQEDTGALGKTLPSRYIGRGHIISSDVSPDLH